MCHDGLRHSPSGMVSDAPTGQQPSLPGHGTQKTSPGSPEVSSPAAKPSQPLKVAPLAVLVNLAVLDLLGQLPLPLPRLLRALQLQAVLAHGKPHGADALVVEAEAGADALVEGLCGLAGGVDVAGAARLHVALFVVDAGVDDAVADGLGDHVLGALLAVDAEADADVAEGDARVGEREHAHARADDVLAQAARERVGAVGTEGGGVLRDDAGEGDEVAAADGADEV